MIENWNCPHCGEYFTVDTDELDEQTEEMGYFIIECPYCGEDINED